MLQRFQFATILAFCISLALQFPVDAQVERPGGSRGRSNPGTSRAVGVEETENPDISLMLSPPVNEEAVVGFLGASWMARGIALSMMQMAGEVAENPLRPERPTPEFVIDLEPTPAPLPDKVELNPAPTDAEGELFPEPELVIEPVPLDEASPVDTAPEMTPTPVEEEKPSEFARRQEEEAEAARSTLDSSMPVLSELMAKMDKLDPPSEADPGDDENTTKRKWRAEDKKSDEPEFPALELNSSDGLAFRLPGDEALQSPGHGAEVDYPDNPNTNLVDGEIARLSPGIGAGSNGQDSPRLLAMTTLSSDSNFEQALVMSPVSKTGLGAVTTSVRAANPGSMAFRTISPTMPLPQVSPRIRSLASGNPKQMQVALTFDDGPHPEYTNQILAILNHYDIEATFFFVGIQARKHPQWVQMANQAGHEIASQTYDHFRMPKLPLEEKQYQIDEYQRLIENLIGVTPRFMRPPGGQLDDVTKRLLAERGMVLGLWDVALNDTSHGKTASDMLKTAKREVRPGSILLVHDGIHATIEVLPELIEYLHAKGYKFVTMSELAQGL